MSRSPVVANALAITSTIPYATTTPASAPTAAATTSYASPSNKNIWTRCPRREQSDHLVAQLRSAFRPTSVGHEDGLDETFAAQKVLGGRQGHEKAGVWRGASLVLHDRLDSGCFGPAPDEDSDRVAGAGVELVGCFGVEIDLAGTEIRERDDVTAASHLAEPAQAGGVAGKERYTRLVLPARDVLDRDGLDDHRRNAINEPGVGGDSGDPVGVGSREIARARRSAVDGER